MRIIFIIFIQLVMFSNPSFASDFSDKVLGSSLKKLTLGRSTPEDAVKLLGKPGSVERKSQHTEIAFYNLNGVDFDTALTFKNDKLVKIFQGHLKQKLKLSDFEKILTPNQIQGAYLKASRSGGHDRGRHIIIEDFKRAFSAKFKTTNPNTLAEFEIWQEGQERP